MSARCFKLARLFAGALSLAMAPLAVGQVCVDYDPPPGAGPWSCCGTIFFPDGVKHETAPFIPIGGPPIVGGFAEIWNACNGVGGHSLNVNNVNVMVDARDYFGGPGGPGVKKFEFWYEDFGGSVNLGVNGMLEPNAPNFHNIPAARFPGFLLTHSAVWTGFSWRGTVLIEVIGPNCIEKVTIGGQELCIDDLCADFECDPPLPCPEDLDGDGVVGVPDLLTMLAAWGPCAGCPEDLDGDNNVGVPDLLLLLAAFGPCP